MGFKYIGKPFYPLEPIRIVYKAKLENKDPIQELSKFLKVPYNRLREALLEALKEEIVTDRAYVNILRKLGVVDKKGQVIKYHPFFDKRMSSLIKYLTG